MPSRYVKADIWAGGFVRSASHDLVLQTAGPTSRKLGYTVFQAGDPREAVLVADGNAGRIDLLVSDDTGFAAPGFSGWRRRRESDAHGAARRRVGPKSMGGRAPTAHHLGGVRPWRCVSERTSRAMLRDSSSTFS